MKIAIASGKGGTGKTTVATSLALVAGEGAQLLDCDVEEPNCHLFLQPTIETREPVEVMVPVVDEDKCASCGACGEFCEYNAIVSLKTTALVFPELCHGCYGCVLVCPENAISEGKRPIGELETGSSHGVEFVHGRLTIGEAMSPPLIRAVKRRARDDGGLTIIDAPPGTSCPVVESIHGVDLAILVTEPTPFGLHDLQLALELTRALDIPCGVVINRAGIGNGETGRYLEQQGVRILQEIPDDRRIAEAYSRGELIVEALPEYRRLFEELLAAATEEVER